MRQLDVAITASRPLKFLAYSCLLYTSDAADERSSVDLGGRRIIKKKKREKIERIMNTHIQQIRKRYTYNRRTKKIQKVDERQ